MSSSSLEVIRRFSGCRVLVIGDVMLDEFIHGDVRRISPEAPVPILELRERVLRPGGAANVAMNIKSLGGEPHLIGVTGDDEAREWLVTSLDRAGVDASGLVVDPARPTTRKTRVVAGHQQIVRVDAERSTPLDRGVESTLVAVLERAVVENGACVISDYAKGVVTRNLATAAIRSARERGIASIVDPKGRDYQKYGGASLITPNLMELAQALNASVHGPAATLLSHAVSELLPALGDSALLVTRGAEGMTLLRRDQPQLDLPTFATSVFDVTGAGDTVVAALAIALASGAALEDAIAIANHAAGVVVRKLGTATANQEELLNALATRQAIG